MNQRTALIGGKELLAFIFFITWLVLLLKVNVVDRRSYASSLASI